MTVDELKGAICKYFNDSAEFSAPLVKSPTNSPASVGIDGVRQYGEKFTPPPGNHHYRFSQVATVHFVEVEGDGDTLRAIRNELQLPAFIEYARNNGFTVWDFTNIEKIDTYDGDFYVRQWRFTATLNFIDKTPSGIERIETVHPLELQPI